MLVGGHVAHALRRRSFTVDEYHRLGEAGILPEDSRVELIRGVIMVRERIGARHAGTVDRLARLWMSRLGHRAVVRVQNPVEFPEALSELQPDIALLRPQPDFYTRAHPRAVDVLLILEVADISLRLDRRVKIPLYARAGVPEAWLLDLTTDRVEVHRSPTPAGYRDRVTLERGAELSALAFPDVVITVHDLLGLYSGT
jgi:Uma2 family endonuclease